MQNLNELWCDRIIIASCPQSAPSDPNDARWGSSSASMKLMFWVFDTLLLKAQNPFFKKNKKKTKLFYIRVSSVSHVGSPPQSLCIKMKEKRKQLIKKIALHGMNCLCTWKVFLFSPLVMIVHGLINANAFLCTHATSREHANILYG